MGQLAAGRVEMLQQHEPNGRHCGGAGDLVTIEQLKIEAPSSLAPGITREAPAIGAAKVMRPAIGMEHRHDRHQHVARVHADHVAVVRHQSVQDVRAMRVKNALRVAGRPRRVAHAGRSILVEGFPGEITVDLADPFLVGHDVGQRACRHVRGVGEHDIAFYARKLARELLQQWNECQIEQHHLVLRVIDDPDDLLGKQARIDGMIDRANSHDPVPRFEMAPGVPGERRDAITQPDAVAIEPLREAQRARAHLGVVRGVHMAFDRAGDDRSLGMVESGMVDDAVAEQRPILHQPEHGGFLHQNSRPAMGGHFEKDYSSLRCDAKTANSAAPTRGI